MRTSTTPVLRECSHPNIPAAGAVKPLDVYDDLPIVDPLDGLQGNDKVASILDVDDEGVGLRHRAADGAELLATLNRINLKPDLDMVTLWHLISSSHAADGCAYLCFTTTAQITRRGRHALIAAD